MKVNLKVKREKVKLKGKILYLSFGFALCIFSFAISAFAQDKNIVLQHRPENTSSGYHVVSLIENNGVKDKKDQRFDLPIIYSSETTETTETTGTTETLDFSAVLTRGLPIHLPGTTVAASASWDGWSEIGQLIVHHIYTFSGIKEVAGRRCAEVIYKLQAAQKTPDGGAAQEQNIVTGDGRFLFDLNNGVVVVHTWRMNGIGLKADYAAVLNI